MIYDIFTFSNELDLLEIRLNYLNDIVDYFVITESPQTFTGLQKKLNFYENKDRFNLFLDKIIYFVAPPITDIPSILDYKNNEPCWSCWVREHFQMNYALSLLDHIDPNDLVIINPIDEIPKKEIIQKYIPNITTPRCCVQDLYFYKLNLIAINNQLTLDLLKNNPEHYQARHKLDNSLGESYKWYGSVISQKKYISKDFWPNQHHQKPFMEIIENCGWHYTYVNTDEEILTKIKSFSHADYFRDNNADAIDIIKNALANKKEIIPADRELKQIDLDSNNCPQYILDNINKFKHIIIS
jgi:beta-1,4-mannosyl-glycoprotein beta-1,4-N-acetylglucosaminyltransferase